MYTVLYPVNKLIIGGAEQQLLELVRGLDKDVFHPIVAPLYAGGALEPEFEAVPGLEIIHLHRSGKLDPSPLWKVTRLLRSRRIDIVQPFLSPATFFGLLPALTRPSTITIVTERCGVRQSRGLGYKTYRTIEDWFSRVANAVVPNSVAGEEMLVARGLPKSKIRVVYNGINFDRLAVDAEAAASYRHQISADENVFIVGMLASLTRAKGHASTIRALAELRDRHPSIRLAIVGDGPERQELEALAASLGLDDKTTFFGYRRDVSNFLATFDSLVSASLDNEGCSNSILEAMALGVPIVATDIGGNRELVQPGETGRLVVPNDPTSLADAIAACIEEQQATASMACRAQMRIKEQFGLDRMVRDYEQLYRELLGRTVAYVDADGKLIMMKT